MLLFANLTEFVPLASIAGILLFIAWGLVDFDYIKRVLSSSKADSSVLAATFAATLILPLEYAVFVGIALNIALYLQRTTPLQIQEMVNSSSGYFAERPLSQSSESDAMRFLQLEGALFFAQADEFEAKLQKVLRSDTKVVLFRMRRVHSIDTTMMGVLYQFAARMKNSDRHVLLCGLHMQLRKRLDDFGITDLIGSESVFLTDTDPFRSASEAIVHAKELMSADNAKTHDGTVKTPASD